MAVKIEKGGVILIFLIGLALVGYSLVHYGVIDPSKWSGSKGSSSSEKVDTTKPLPPLATTSSDDSAEVRVRINVWVGCAGGLVANGGLEVVFFECRVLAKNLCV